MQELGMGSGSGHSRRWRRGSRKFWLGFIGGVAPQLCFWTQLLLQLVDSADEGRQYLGYLAFGPVSVALFCSLLGSAMYFGGGAARVPGSGVLVGTAAGIGLYLFTCGIAGTPLS